MLRVSSADNLRFRMTLWPGVPLPLPPLLPRKETYRLHESGLVLIGTGGSREIGAGARTGEIYLDLYSLDLEDPAAIVAFANEYGTPSGALVHHAVGRSSWFSGLFFPDDDRRVRDRALEQDPLLFERSANPDHPEWELTEITTLESVGFAARVLGDLTDAWRIVSADPLLDLSSHKWRLDYPVVARTEEKDFDAFVLLTIGLTPLLARLHPYIQPAPASRDVEPQQLEPAHPGPGVDATAATSISFAHVAEFCALELFNHIAGSDVYRKCQNETCGRIFVRQYGRSEHGQSRREGVMYCTRHCAQARAARDYRRRRRVRDRTSSTSD
jgi:hypothetical protein